MVKTRHEVLIDMGDNLMFLIQKGFIPIHLLDWKLIYEKFLIERKQQNVTQSVSNVSEEFDISNRKVYKVISFMSTP